MQILKSKKDFSYLLVMILKTEVVCQRCSSKKVLCKFAPNLPKNTHPEMWFQQSCFTNHTTAWVFSSKFPAYLQNTFFEEHLWQTTSVFNIITNKYEKSFLLFFSDGLLLNKIQLLSSRLPFLPWWMLKTIY